MPAVFIGIGSNLGNRSENINKAILFIESIKGVSVDKVSSLLETEPVKAIGPNYLNGVVKVKTDLPPEDLLKKLQNIEKDLGRAREFKNAPRTLDLDILLYDDEIIDKPKLKIPHPRIFERDFVMRPLLEIEPDIAKLSKKLREKMPDTRYREIVVSKTK